jgi:hypothetical protein
VASFAAPAAASSSYAPDADVPSSTEQAARRKTCEKPRPPFAELAFPFDDVHPPGCTLRFDPSRHTPLDLRFSPTDPAFARITTASARLLYPRDDRGSPAAIVEADTWRIHGYVAADDLPLHLRRRIVVGGFFVPSAAASLTFEGGELTGVVVALPVPDWLRVRDEKLLVAHLRCADVDVSEHPFPLGEDATWTKAAPGKFLWSVVPLSTIPNGEPIADIDATDPPPEYRPLPSIQLPIATPPSRAYGVSSVRIVERREGWRRVVLHPRGGFVFGWVPAASVDAISTVLGGGHQVDVSDEALVPQLVDPFARPWTCATDVPIVATSGGRALAVGLARSAARLPLDDRFSDSVIPLMLPGVVHAGSSCGFPVVMVERNATTTCVPLQAVGAAPP